MTIAQPSSFLPPHGRKHARYEDLTAPMHQLRMTLSTTELDDYEREYSQKWLKRIFTTCNDTSMLDQVADLLSMLSNGHQNKTNRGKGPYTYSFASPQGEVSIIIGESYMQDVHATGFQTWSSSVWLASRVLANPTRFLPCSSPGDTTATKVLELGSGTGLAGIATYKSLLQQGRPAQVSLSDYDSPTLENLMKNVHRNTMPSSDACSLEWAYLDWNTIADDGSLPVFDTILGADIVYEPEHADLLYRVVGILLAKTSEAVFHLVVVMRPTHIRDIALLQERFTADPVPDQPSLCITACEDIQGNESSPGESSQYPHRYYEIRWQNLAAL